MKKNIRDRTISLIKEYLPEIGVHLPLRNDDVYLIVEFFQDMEDGLSNALSCGDEIDRDLLDDAAHVYDDLAITYDGDFVDIDDLNRRLMS